VKRHAVPILLAAFAVAVAAEDPFAPRQRSWDGETRDLAATVAWLAGEDNPTRLADGVDAARSEPLPFIDGTYWEAVLAVCEAYDLRILPPVRHRQLHMIRPDPRRAVIGIECGPVVLAAAAPPDAEEMRDDPEAAREFIRRRLRDPGASATPASDPLVIADGPLAIGIADAGIWVTDDRDGIEAEVRSAFRFRLEPRFALDAIGPSELRWTRIVGSDGGELAFSPHEADASPRSRPTFTRQPSNHQGTIREEGRQAPLVSVAYGASPPLRGFRFRGELVVGLLASETFDRRFEIAGDGEPEDAVLAVGGRSIRIEFADADEGPTVTLRYRAEDGWLGTPRVRCFDRRDRRLGTRGSRMSSGPDGIDWRLTLRPGLESVRVEIAASRFSRRVPVPLDFAIEMPASGER